MDITSKFKATVKTIKTRLKTQGENAGGKGALILPKKKEGSEFHKQLKTVIRTMWGEGEVDVTCLTQLLQSYEAVCHEVKSAAKVVERVPTIVTSLSNLAQQYECVKKVSLDHTPLAKHEGLQDKLRSKLLIEIGTKVEKLDTTIATLRDAYKVVSSHSVESETALSNCREVATLQAVAESGTTLPGVAHMVFSLREAATTLVKELYRHEDFLARVSCEAADIVSATDEWTCSTRELKQVKEKLDLTRALLQEELARSN